MRVCSTSIQAALNEHHRTEATAVISGQNHAVAACSDGAATDVLAAVWCRSVGASWTLELYTFGCGGTLGTIIDWISSGIPISQPEPEALVRELLAQRGLQLFHDCSVGLSTHNRHRIGYVCRDAEVA